MANNPVTLDYQDYINLLAMLNHEGGNSIGYSIRSGNLDDAMGHVTGLIDTWLNRSAATGRDVGQLMDDDNQISHWNTSWDFAQRKAASLDPTIRDMANAYIQGIANGMPQANPGITQYLNVPYLEENNPNGSWARDWYKPEFIVSQFGALLGGGDESKQHTFLVNPKWGLDTSTPLQFSLSSDLKLPQPQPDSAAQQAFNSFMAARGGQSLNGQPIETAAGQVPSGAQPPADAGSGTFGDNPVGFGAFGLPPGSTPYTLNQDGEASGPPFLPPTRAASGIDDYLAQQEAGANYGYGSSDKTSGMSPDGYGGWVDAFGQHFSNTDLGLPPGSTPPPTRAASGIDADLDALNGSGTPEQNIGQGTYPAPAPPGIDQAPASAWDEPAPTRTIIGYDQNNNPIYESVRDTNRPALGGPPPNFDVGNVGGVDPEEEFGPAQPAPFDASRFEFATPTYPDYRDTNRPALGSPPPNFDVGNVGGYDAAEQFGPDLPPPPPSAPPAPAMQAGNGGVDTAVPIPPDYQVPAPGRGFDAVVLGLVPPDQRDYIASQLANLTPDQKAALYNGTMTPAQALDALEQAGGALGSVYRSKGEELLGALGGAGALSAALATDRTPGPFMPGSASPGDSAYPQARPADLAGNPAYDYAGTPELRIGQGSYPAPAGMEGAPASAWDQPIYLPPPGIEAAPTAAWDEPAPPPSAPGFDASRFSDVPAGFDPTRFDAVTTAPPVADFDPSRFDFAQPAQPAPTATPTIGPTDFSQADTGTSGWFTGNNGFDNGIVMPPSASQASSDLGLPSVDAPGPLAPIPWLSAEAPAAPQPEAPQPPSSPSPYQVAGLSDSPSQAAIDAQAGFLPMPPTDIPGDTSFWGGFRGLFGTGSTPAEAGAAPPPPPPPPVQSAAPIEMPQPPAAPPAPPPGGGSDGYTYGGVDFGPVFGAQGVTRGDWNGLYNTLSHTDNAVDLVRSQGTDLGPIFARQGVGIGDWGGLPGGSFDFLQQGVPSGINQYNIPQWQGMGFNPFAPEWSGVSSTFATEMAPYGSSVVSPAISASGALTGGDGSYYEGNADGGSGTFNALAMQNFQGLQNTNAQQVAAIQAQSEAINAAQYAMWNSYNPSYAPSSGFGYIAPAPQAYNGGFNYGSPIQVGVGPVLSSNGGFM